MGDNIEGYDSELEHVLKLNEQKEYYKIRLPSGGEVFRCYPPSYAELCEKRGLFKILDKLILKKVETSDYEE